LGFLSLIRHIDGIHKFRIASPLVADVVYRFRFRLSMSAIHMPVPLQHTSTVFERNRMWIATDGLREQPAATVLMVWGPFRQSRAISHHATLGSNPLISKLCVSSAGISTNAAD